MKGQGNRKRKKEAEADGDILKQRSYKARRFKAKISFARKFPGLAFNIFEREQRGFEKKKY